MNNEKLLIVEDEKIIALDLQRRLERFGYSVVGTAGDGEEAIRQAGELDPDMILMDIMLSGSMNGIEAAKVIKERHGIPIIFLTAFADEPTLERAKEVEPYGYILKPFKERELYSTIDIALYKHSMERRLKGQERLFSAILHSINDGIIATDTALCVRFMNPVAEKLVGIREGQAKGQPVASFLALLDQRSGKDLLSDGVPLVDRRPFFFSDVTVKHPSGRGTLVDGSITRIHEKENETDGFVIALRDISEIKRLSETINFQASHDSLTGLSNREEFTFKLGEIIRSVQSSGGNHAFLSMDVDRFKAINDTCGALAGDELLRQVGRHIVDNIPRDDLSARMGGDEFGLLLRDCNPEDSLRVARRLQEAVASRRFVWEDRVMPVTLSIGVVPIDQATIDAHEVLAAADDALHLAKEEGGNRINVFDNSESKYRKRRGEMEWIGKINGAIEDDRFLLYYQTIEALVPHADRPPKAEILVRMVNEDGSIARPMDFIPAAERYNLMPAIDRWVIRESFKAYRRHRDGAGALAGRNISINLSGPSLLDESLIGFILDERAASGVPAELVCLEVTETAAIQNLAHATRFMAALKEQGFSFALDDFGSGFSSFGYLRNLPVDYLKIDGSLVRNVDESDVSAAMVGSINSIGHVMGIKTIAEFVGSVEVRDKVTELGVDYGQGYVFSEPVPVDPK